MSVLSLKYRPTKLSEVIGQPVVTRTLTNAILSNQMHHAYLFHGSMGSGKTSVSRILACSENCQVSPGLNPCGKCNVCTKVSDGSHVDIQEIDAASNAGKVEQIRKLKSTAQYGTVDGAKTRYFIIDECLPEETRITMSSGDVVPIGSLIERHEYKPDQEKSVASRDMTTGKLKNQKIIRYIKIPNNKKMYEIKIKNIDGTVRGLRITGNHSVFVVSEGKIKTQDLKVGQKVYLEWQMTGEIVSIREIDCADEFVYNLEVESDTEQNKNYFADGVLVSNCHACSSEAGQSLLKFLEEPPDNVRFVLCTTEVNKVIPTILSRCQVHEFRKIYWRTLAEYLEVIAKKEGIEVTKDSLLLCAKLSSGSVRNALQNLDKLITYSGESKCISHEDALSTFSVASDSMFYDLIDQIIGHGGHPDATNAYKIVNSLLLSGTSFNFICDNISELLRNILVGLTSSSAGDILMISDSSKMRLKEQIKKCKSKIPAILESIAVLNNARVSEEYGLSADISLQTWIVQSIFLFQRQ